MSRSGVVWQFGREARCHLHFWWGQPVWGLVPDSYGYIRDSYTICNQLLPKKTKARKRRKFIVKLVVCGMQTLEKTKGKKKKKKKKKTRAQKKTRRKIVQKTTSRLIYSQHQQRERKETKWRYLRPSTRLKPLYIKLRHNLAMRTRERWYWDPKWRIGINIASHSAVQNIRWQMNESTSSRRFFSTVGRSVNCLVIKVYCIRTDTMTTGVFVIIHSSLLTDIKHGFPSM